MKILVTSPMWPGLADPDFGVHVAQLSRALETLGHEVDYAVIDRRGGSPLKYFGLAADIARHSRPEVVLAHFLVPTGLLAEVCVRAPSVLMAHGQDVHNAETSWPLRMLTRHVVGRAAHLIANSAHLAARLEQITGRRAEVIDCGVDLDLFTPACAPVEWPGERPRFLCVGSLTDRKNVLRLAAAFDSLGHGSLVFVGDGPLREMLTNRPRITVVGRLSHAAVPGWIAACDVLCQPSTSEAFGQSTLEAMAVGRSVVATKMGGPVEFVSADAGVLIDPFDIGSIAVGLHRAAAMPMPNCAGRPIAAAHDVKCQAQRVATLLEHARISHVDR